MRMVRETSWIEEVDTEDVLLQSIAYSERMEEVMSCWAGGDLTF